MSAAFPISLRIHVREWARVSGADGQVNVAASQEQSASTEARGELILVVILLAGY